MTPFGIVLSHLVVQVGVVVPSEHLRRGRRLYVREEISVTPSGMVPSHRVGGVRVNPSLLFPNTYAGASAYMLGGEHA